MELNIIDKANFLIQSDVESDLINQRLGYTSLPINNVRTGVLAFDQLSLLQIKQLARYYDIYGDNELAFQDLRSFLYHYVSGHEFFHNGELATCIKDMDGHPHIYAVYIINPTTFIDSIVDKHSFHDLFERVADLSKEELNKYLKRFFFCQISNFITIGCAGYKLISH